MISEKLERSTLSGGFGGLEKGQSLLLVKRSCLTSESVQGPALAFEGIDNIHGGYCLPLGMLSVGDGITDDILQEHLEYTSGLLIDES